MVRTMMYGIGDTITFINFDGVRRTGKVIDKFWDDEYAEGGFTVEIEGGYFWGVDSQVIGNVPLSGDPVSLSIGGYMAAYSKGLVEAMSNGFRRGQYAYNLLHNVRHDLACRVVGTDSDPFYDDQRLDKFLDWVVENW